MLISFLNSHPHIYARGEIFKRLNGKNYKTILTGMFSKHPRNVKAAGFKIFYYHPQDVDSCTLWEELINMQKLYVIHLKRRNILRTLISRKIAGLQDFWSIEDGRSSQSSGEKAVEFTVEELKKGFEQTRQWEKEYKNMFNAHPMLDLYYEDLVSSPEREFEKTMNFLDIQYIEPQTKLRKQNPEKSSHLISNFKELKQAFSDTEWALFFKY